MSSLLSAAAVFITRLLPLVIPRAASLPIDGSTCVSRVARTARRTLHALSLAHDTAWSGPLGNKDANGGSEDDVSAAAQTRARAAAARLIPLPSPVSATSIQINSPLILCTPSQISPLAPVTYMGGAVAASRTAGALAILHAAASSPPLARLLSASAPLLADAGVRALRPWASGFVRSAVNASTHSDLTAALAAPALLAAACAALPSDDHVSAVHVLRDTVSISAASIRGLGVGAAAWRLLVLGAGGAKGLPSSCARAHLRARLLAVLEAAVTSLVRTCAAETSSVEPVPLLIDENDEDMGCTRGDGSEGDMSRFSAAGPPRHLAALLRRSVALKSLVEIHAGEEEPTLARGSAGKIDSAISAVAQKTGVVRGSLRQSSAEGLALLPLLRPPGIAVATAAYVAAAGVIASAAALAAAATGLMGGGIISLPLSTALASALALRTMRAAALALARHPDALLPVLADSWPSIAALLPQGGALGAAPVSGGAQLLLQSVVEATGGGGLPAVAALVSPSALAGIMPITCSPLEGDDSAAERSAVPQSAVRATTSATQPLRPLSTPHRPSLSPLEAAAIFALARAKSAKNARRKMREKVEPRNARMKAQREEHHLTLLGFQSNVASAATTAASHQLQSPRIVVVNDKHHADAAPPRASASSLALGIHTASFDFIASLAGAPLSSDVNDAEGSAHATILGAACSDFLSSRINQLVWPRVRAVLAAAALVARDTQRRAALREGVPSVAPICSFIISALRLTVSLSRPAVNVEREPFDPPEGGGGGEEGDGDGSFGFGAARTLPYGSLDPDSTLPNKCEKSLSTRFVLCPPPLRRHAFEAALLIAHIQEGAKKIDNCGQIFRAASKALDTLAKYCDAPAVAAALRACPPMI
jgi:hypothetical protein